MPTLLREPAVEELLQLGSGRLKKLRHVHRTTGAAVNAPPYVQIGRAIRYEPDALTRWIADQSIAPSEPADADDSASSAKV